MPEPTTAATAQTVLTLEQLRIDVADVLAEPADSLGEEENLLERGLDSIRIMTLVDRWSRGGLETSFLELADDPTLTGWYALLEKKVTR